MKKISTFVIILLLPVAIAWATSVFNVNPVPNILKWKSIQTTST